ncbi:hypothetical protein VP01_8244g1, partial [Puccinia sorghi]
VKAFLPLGSQGMSYVQDFYNIYATEREWAAQDLYPLKMKFYAKATQKVMDSWAHLIEFNDPESGNDEEAASEFSSSAYQHFLTVLLGGSNGVGGPIPMTLDETSQQNAGDVNPQVECDLNANNESDEIGKGCNNTNASPKTKLESRHFFSPWLSQSEFIRSRITLGQSSTSQVGPQRRAGLQAEMQSPMKRTGQSGQAALGLEEHLTAFFDLM